MKLLDVRKLTIKQRARVHFQLANGMECIINENGISSVPQLQGPPDFNLEEEFAKADQFTLLPVPPAGGKRKEKTKPQPLTREQLEALVNPSAGAKPQQGPRE
jgi:hypothetical protein